MTFGYERRAKTRRRVCYGAEIVINPARERIAAIVRDISDTGASIRLAEDCVVPPLFQLSINYAGIDCVAEVVWKNGRDIGVAFTDKTGVVFAGKLDVESTPEEPKAAAAQSWIGDIRRTLTFTSTDPADPKK